MPTDRQVHQIAIQTGTYSDGEFTPSGDAVLYDIWNFDGRWRTDWRGGIGNTRSLSGFDLSGRGGYRLDLRINLRNTNTEQTEAIKALLDDIFDIPVLPKAVKISPDGDIDNGTVCNIRAGSVGVRREFTINRPVISMDFSGVERRATIPDTFQILGEGDAPDAPLNFSVIVSYDPTLAGCSWTAVSGVDGYNVYLKSNGEFVKDNAELITGTTYDIESLADGDYEAYVVSVLNDVESAPSNTEAFNVSVPVAPDPPTNFDVEILEES